MELFLEGLGVLFLGPEPLIFHENWVALVHWYLKLFDSWILRGLGLKPWEVHSFSEGREHDLQGERVVFFWPWDLEIPMAGG